MGFRLIRILKTLQWIMIALLMITVLTKDMGINKNIGFNSKRKMAKSFLPEITSTASTASSTSPTSSTTPIPTVAYTKNMYLEFSGRFGNVIFEITAAYGMLLEAHYNKMYFIDNQTQGIQAGRFTRVFPKFRNLVNVVTKFPPNLVVVKELGPNKFHRKTVEEMKAATKDVHFAKYLGVPSYWWPKYKKEIKEMLAVSEELQNKVRNYLFKIASRQNVSLAARKDTLKSGISPKLSGDVPVLVGVHSRRGDKIAFYQYQGWVAPEKAYFQKAMDYYRSKFKRVYFIVVSQHKDWGKQNIVGKDVIHSDAAEDIVEFGLLTLCDHFILSLGSFGWWAGFLTGGEVVYFPGHVKPNSTASTFYNSTQYFLPHWKPMR